MTGSKNLLLMDGKYIPVSRKMKVLVFSVESHEIIREGTFEEYLDYYQFDMAHTNTKWMDQYVETRWVYEPI